MCSSSSSTSWSRRAASSSSRSPSSPRPAAIGTAIREPAGAGCVRTGCVPPLRPYERALARVHAGDRGVELRLRSSLGEDERLPASLFFRSGEALFPWERYALDLCAGNVVDLGAGTGVHALELQRRGIPVVAVENSRTLVRIAGERGVERPVRADFRYWAGARFDTALMLMNGVGPTATLDGLRRFLLHAHRLLAPGGKLLLDSAEALQGPERAPAPSAAWPPAGGYRGQAWIELSLGDEVGRPFRELYADMDTLARTAHDAGWRTDIAFEDEQGGYLARLTRI